MLDSGVPLDVAQKVSDVNVEPLGDTPYQRLNQKILERTMQAKRIRFQQLLNGGQLHDRWPSLLAVLDELSLDSLAAFADIVYEIISPAVTTASETPDTSAVSRLEERINELTASIATLQTPSRYQHSRDPRRRS
ncbi:hypothetical protein HPB49_014256 [Dermacentor silvarum]|uniref:Uncharacterized protein n=1 Tax=Dermacentor silvarum TaxID=543639 RepID=A0ACB8CRU4_DERSI|nr:hypothetical protein HPB49_014256 [Dermacentor silvarum]